MMEFGSMWNNILFFVCIWFCACSTVDPEIPDYESLENDPLPIATIKSASRVFLREATLSIVLSPTRAGYPAAFIYVTGKIRTGRTPCNLKSICYPCIKMGLSMSK